MLKKRRACVELGDQKRILTLIRFLKAYAAEKLLLQLAGKHVDFLFIWY